MAQHLGGLLFTSSEWISFGTVTLVNSGSVTLPAPPQALRSLLWLEPALWAPEKSQESDPVSALLVLSISLSTPAHAQLGIQPQSELFGCQLNPPWGQPFWVVLSLGARGQVHWDCFYAG